jgi:hypothetical protein
MNKQHRVLMLSLSNMNDGNNLGLCIQHHPNVEVFLQAPQFRNQFVQLQMVTYQVMEETGVQSFRMHCDAAQPALYDSLIVFENPTGGCYIDSFTRRGHDLFNARYGRFQRLHRPVLASTEFRPTCLAAPSLNIIRPIMDPIPYQRMDTSIHNLIITAQLVEAAMAFCREE